ncbi:unnamed protein product [Lathyrus sativus]|nr:unnamed protein product [Lathyrus sativus]
MGGITIVSYKFNLNGEYSEFLQAKRGIRQRDPISLLLFVILMKYMHRSLIKMHKIPILTIMANVKVLTSKTSHLLMMCCYFIEEILNWPLHALGGQNCGENLSLVF